MFSDATEYFSCEGKDAPTLTDVIPSMDIIDECLVTDMTNTALDPVIHVAVGSAKCTINHYYDKSDESAAYRIAMSKSPSSLDNPTRSDYPLSPQPLVQAPVLHQKQVA